MAEAIILPPAFGDLERIRAFYADDRAARIVEGELRELVISRGKHRFLALYRYLERPEHVRVLRIRHQRELGYPAR